MKAIPLTRPWAALRQTCSSTRTSPASARSPASSRPRPAAPTCISPPRICSATAICCRTPSRGVVLGTQPGVALHMSRDAGIVAARMDMDQSQFPADVSPAAGGAGIYDTADPDPAAVEKAIQFRRILLHQHRRQSDRRRPDDDGLDQEPALLPGDLGDGRARSAPTPTPTSSIRLPRRLRRPPPAIRRPARLRLLLTGAVLRRRHGGHVRHRPESRHEHAPPRVRRRRWRHSEHASHGGVRQHHHHQLCPRGVRRRQ